jgi:hypothetical protein
MSLIWAIASILKWTRNKIGQETKDHSPHHTNQQVVTLLLFSTRLLLLSQIAAGQPRALYLTALYRAVPYLQTPFPDQFECYYTRFLSVLTLLWVVSAITCACNQVFLNVYHIYTFST